MKQYQTKSAKDLEAFYTKKDKAKFYWRLRVIKNFELYGLSKTQSQICLIPDMN